MAPSTSPTKQCYRCNLGGLGQDTTLDSILWRCTLTFCKTDSFLPHLNRLMAAIPQPPLFSLTRLRTFSACGGGAKPAGTGGAGTYPLPHGRHHPPTRMAYPARRYNVTAARGLQGVCCYRHCPTAPSSSLIPPSTSARRSAPQHHGGGAPPFYSLLFAPAAAAPTTRWRDRRSCPRCCRAFDRGPPRKTGQDMVELRTYRLPRERAAGGRHLPRRDARGTLISIYLTL